VHSSDEELAQRWKTGDMSAFEAIFRGYERRVLNVAVRMVGSLEDAEDIKQETFIRAHRSIGSFRGGKFSSWIFKIATNLCLDHARRICNKSVSIDELVEEASWQGDDGGLADPQYLLISQEFSRSVKLVLASIPPHYRILLVLRHIDDMSYNEIADVIGCSVKALGVRLHRAREIFKERMKPFLSPDGGSVQNEVQRSKISDIPAL
jgi:RNA polymerase sigma-70 factor (ECF subfamily)